MTFSDLVHIFSSATVSSLILFHKNIQVCSVRELNKVNTVEIDTERRKEDHPRSISSHPFPYPLLPLRGLIDCVVLNSRAFHRWIFPCHPTGRQLSAMGKEGLYAEDRTDVSIESSIFSAFK